MGIIIWLIVGAIAGWLAGMVVKGGGFGLIGDIIVGIVGGIIAGWLLPQLGIVIAGGIVRRRDRPFRRGDSAGHYQAHQTRLFAR